MVHKLFQILPHRLGDLDKRLARRVIGRGDDNGHAAVAAFADFSEDGNFAKEWNVLARGFLFAAAVAENFHALAVGRGEVAHVFHDAEAGHVHLPEHRDAFAHDAE